MKIRIDTTKKRLKWENGVAVRFEHIAFPKKSTGYMADRTRQAHRLLMESVLQRGTNSTWNYNLLDAKHIQAYLKRTTDMDHHESWVVAKGLVECGFVEVTL